MHHFAFFLGIWGSAFTIMLQRVLNEGQSPTDTVKNMSNSGDLRQELRKQLLSAHLLRGFRQVYVHTKWQLVLSFPQ